MSVWTESCSPASPTSTLVYHQAFFFSSLFLPHPPFYFVFLQTKTGLQSAARGFSWEFLISHEKRTTSLCSWELWASDLLLPALLLTLGHSFLSRPIRYTAVSPVTFFGFLSWHQAQFSAANLAPIIFALFSPSRYLIIAALFLFGFLCRSYLSSGSLCITVDLASVKLWRHSLDILLLLIHNILVSLRSCQCISVSWSENSAELKCILRMTKNPWAEVEVKVVRR